MDIPNPGFSDLMNLGFGLYDRFGGTDSGVAGDDARFMNDFAWKQSLRNEDFTQDLARHGIKMRVDDAVSAGLHPLVGAGGNPAQGGFSAAAFTPTMGSQQKQFNNPGFSMGQNMSRAAAATMTEQEKAIQAAELGRILADTAESQARTALAQKQLREMAMSPSMPNKYQKVMLPDGTSETVYSSDYSQAIMSDPLGMWANSFKKSFGGPDSYKFWGAVGRAGRNLMHPWRRD